jgi:hypothetical protein
MMKTAMKCLLLVLAVSALGGCVQMHSETVINKDGSGIASMTVSLSPVMTEAMDQMAEMGPAFQQDADMPDFDDITREDMEKYTAGHDVKIKKFEKGVVDGRQTLSFDVEFKDLEGLSYVMGATMGEGGGGGLGIVPTGDGNFKLISMEYDFEMPVEEEEEVVEPEMDMSEMDPAMMQKQMELMGKMMGAMAELDISMKITVPGDVISSNAHRVEGKTSIWEVNSDNAMTMQGGMEPEIVFSGKGLKLK